MIQRCFVMLTYFMCMLSKHVIDNNHITDDFSQNYMHTSLKHSPKCDLKEKTADYWFNEAQTILNQKIIHHPLGGIATNVIMFLGEGISTYALAAARPYLEYAEEANEEQGLFAFERFPYSGYSRSSCADTHKPDAACSATAYFCGIKGSKGTIGISAARFGDCNDMENRSNYVDSIARWAQLAGKRTGIVTTGRVTHTYPAGVYAHTTNHAWETDTEVIGGGCSPEDCPDIATQLVYGTTGKGLNVVFGRGRRCFLSKDGHNGFRSDKRNVIKEWKTDRQDFPSKYVSNKSALLEVSDETTHLLGLFDDELQSDKEWDNPKPTLDEMTEHAIKILSQEDKGYFLFVHAGRTQHAQRSKIAQQVLEFHNAVHTAISMTNLLKTLIVVVTDYSLVDDYNSNAYRNNDNQFSGETSKLKRMKLKESSKEAALGYDLNPGVNIYALGPRAYLFSGMVEQNVIPHIMAYASCVGKGRTACNSTNAGKSKRPFDLGKDRLK